MGFFGKKAEDHKKAAPKITVINNIDKKTRAFYRAFILPRHIATRDGEVKKAMEDELAMHLNDIKANGLEEEYKVYKQAQEDKQAMYDEWQALETESRNAQGNKAPRTELIEIFDKAEAAKARFIEFRDAFKKQYH